MQFGGAPSGAYETRAAAMELVDVQEVLTSEGTASATYVDLATAGPSVTFTVPAGETWDVLAEWTVLSSVSAAGSGLASSSLDGAVPSDNQSAGVTHASSATVVPAPGMRRYSGLAAGSHTIKIQYRQSGSVTATFQKRRLKVVRVAKA